MVVVNTDSDNIGVFLGYGNGTFQDQLKFSTGFESHPSYVSIGQLNNNQEKDLVFDNSGTNRIGIYLDYKNRIFSKLKMTTLNCSGLRSFVLGHLNDDNWMDIALITDGTFHRFK